MSDDRREALERLIGPVSRETLDALLHFERTFLKWAAQINLAAASTLPDLWQRHILDSAQLLPLAEDAKTWVDLGSGGGFPGAVIAILLTGCPDSRVDLVESNSKKAAFLKTVLGEVAQRTARVHMIRAETVCEELTCPQILTARAFAPLPKIFGYVSPWLAQGATGLFHKGRDHRHELQKAADEWAFDLIEHPSQIEPDAVVLEISQLQRKI